MSRSEGSLSVRMHRRCRLASHLPTWAHPLSSVSYATQEIPGTLTSAAMCGAKRRELKRLSWNRALLLASAAAATTLFLLAFT